MQGRGFAALAHVTASVMLLGALGCGDRERDAVPTATESVPVAPIAPTTEPVLPPFGAEGASALDDSPGARRLALGDTWSCAILEGRRVLCWGHAEGLADPVAGPRILEALAGAVEIAGAGERICARDGAGHVRCVDGNASTAPLGALEGSSSVGVAGRMICATLPEGSLRCDGLGDAQARVAASIDDALAAHSLLGHLCVTRRAHPATCFDATSDWAQQARDATAGASPVGDVGGAPCPIDDEGRARCTRDDFAPPSPIAALAGAGATYCSLGLDAEVRCLSSSGRSMAFRPVPGAPGRAIAIAVRAQRACALYQGDVVRCAGRDPHGEVSGRAPAADGVATVVEGLPPVLDLAVSASRAAAIDAEGALWSWGPHDGTAQRAPGRTRFTAVAAASLPLYALAHGGAVHSVGPSGVAAILRGTRARSLAQGHADAVVAESVAGVPSLLRVRGGRAELVSFPSLRGATDVRVDRHDGLCGVLGARVVCAARELAEPDPPALDGDVVRFFGDPRRRVAVLASGAVRVWGLADLVARDPAVSALALPYPPNVSEPVSAPSLANVVGLWLDGHVTRLDTDGAVRRVVDGVSAQGWERIAGLEEVGEVRRVSANGREGCVLGVDRVVRCWGELVRADGQLRDVGMDSWVSVPVPSASIPLP